MKKTSFFLVTLTMLTTSCANITQIRRQPVPPAYENRINAIGEHKAGRVILRNGVVLETSILRMTKDSLYLQIKNTAESKTIPVKAVNRIVFKDHIIGMGQGFFAGAATGTAIGAGIGSGREMGGLATLAGIAAGGIIGSISGYAIAGRHEFRFGDSQ